MLTTCVLFYRNFITTLLISFIAIHSPSIQAFSMFARFNFICYGGYMAHAAQSKNNQPSNKIFNPQNPR